MPSTSKEYRKIGLKKQAKTPAMKGWGFFINLNFCVVLTTAEKNFQGCSGMALAHSRRPSMAGFRGVRRESPSR